MNENKGRDLFSIMNRFRKLTMKMKIKEVSHGEFHMLGAIYSGKAEKCWKEKSENGIKISELNGIIMGSKPATSKMLKNLEEKGYIERISDVKDKRNIFVKLSKEGEESLISARKGMEEITGNIMERMGDVDMMQLIQLFEKLYVILEDELKMQELKTNRKDKKND